MAETQKPQLVHDNTSSKVHSKPGVASDNTFGGGGGGGPPVDTETQNYIDARVEAVSAKNDARFTEVRSGLESVMAQVAVVAEKVESVDSKVADKPSLAALMGIAFAGVLAVVAVLAFGGDRFDGGVQVQSSVSEQSHEAQRLSQENARQIQEILRILSTDQSSEAP